MLAQLFAPLGASNFVESIKDFKSDFVQVFEEMDGVSKDAGAQFNSGLLYGDSKGTVDMRDYILGCAW